MNSFWNENGTKILGALTAVLGTLASLIAAGAFEELLTKVAIGWLNIFVSLATAGVGGATMARGFNNSAQAKVAAAMETAIKSTPPSQGGFIRPLMLAFLLAVAVPVLVSLGGCSVLQTEGSTQQLSFDQRWKLANDSHTLATRTVRSALDARLISSRDAKAYLGLAENAKLVLDGAWDLRAADISTAEGQLQLANDILIKLQQFLITRGDST